MLPHRSGCLRAEATSCGPIGLLKRRHHPSPAPQDPLISSPSLSRLFLHRSVAIARFYHHPHLQLLLHSMEILLCSYDAHDRDSTSQAARRAHQLAETRCSCNRGGFHCDTSEHPSCSVSACHTLNHQSIPVYLPCYYHLQAAESRKHWPFPACSPRLAPSVSELTRAVQADMRSCSPTTPSASFSSTQPAVVSAQNHYYHHHLLPHACYLGSSFATTDPRTTEPLDFCYCSCVVLFSRPFCQPGWTPSPLWRGSLLRIHRPG